MLQPLDLAIYKSLKVRWNSKLSAFSETQVGVKKRKEFSSLVGRILIKTIKEEICIYPYGRNVIRRDKFNPEALKLYETTSKLNDFISSEEPVAGISSMNINHCPSSELTKQIPGRPTSNQSVSAEQIEEKQDWK